jgi:hypothetical protein
MRSVRRAKREPGQDKIVCGGAIGHYLTNRIRGENGEYLLALEDRWSRDLSQRPVVQFQPKDKPYMSPIQSRFYVPASRLKAYGYGYRHRQMRKPIGKEQLPVLFTCPDCNAISLVIWEMLQGL